MLLSIFNLCEKWNNLFQALKWNNSIVILAFEKLAITLINSKIFVVNCFFVIIIDPFS